MGQRVGRVVKYSRKARQPAYARDVPPTVSTPPCVMHRHEKPPCLADDVLAGRVPRRASERRSLEHATPVCGCEAPGASFCNYDFGSSGNCESCIGFSDASGCDGVGLPAAGAADCKKWCFSLESELSPSPSPLQSAPCCSEHGRRLLFGTVPKCDSSC